MNVWLEQWKQLWTLEVDCIDHPFCYQAKPHSSDKHDNVHVHNTSHFGLSLPLSLWTIMWHMRFKGPLCFPPSHKHQPMNSILDSWLLLSLNYSQKQKAAFKGTNVVTPLGNAGNAALRATLIYFNLNMCLTWFSFAKWGSNFSAHWAVFTDIAI